MRLVSNNYDESLAQILKMMSFFIKELTVETAETVPAISLKIQA